MPQHGRAARYLTLVCVLATVGLGAETLAELRGAPDTKPLVRASLGVRSARAVDATHVEVYVGLSCTDVAGNPEGWRVVSERDPHYAYAKFVRPAAATLKREPEADGAPGASAASYKRNRVTLTLPEPLVNGCDYQFIGQVVVDRLVTAARSAAGLVYGEPARVHEAELDQAVLGLRRVWPLGPGLLEVDFGPNYSVAAGNDPGNFRVSLNGQRVDVVALGRWTTLDTYLPDGWPFTAIVQHAIYLRLARPFAQGDRVRVAVEPSVSPCGAPAEFTFSEQTSITPSLKTNQVGYLPNAPEKRAYLGRWLGSFPESTAAVRRPEAPGTPATGGDGEKLSGLLDPFVQALRRAGMPTTPPAATETPEATDDAPPGEHALAFDTPPRFSLRDAATGAEVFGGQTKLIHRSGVLDEGFYKHDHSGENVYLVDFSAFAKPGRYYVSVPQVGRSLAFRIDGDVYRDAFKAVAHGVFIQRCGQELAPPYSDWRRIACHLKGILPTTQQRLDQHEWHELEHKVDLSRAGDSTLPPERAALDRDPALVALYRLNGDFKDSSGHGYDLTPRKAKQAFSTERCLVPGQNTYFGPTDEEGPVGATGNVPCDASHGYTLAFWVKGNHRINFGGNVVGWGGNWNEPRFVVNASWGVLIGTAGVGGDLRFTRPEDGKWHHLAMVVEPDLKLLGYWDGKLTQTAQAKSNVGGKTFGLGTMEGKEVDGKSFDEVRLYQRPLSAAEIALLGTDFGPQPAKLMIGGGHHDAGDYNPRSHIDVAQSLMDAYEMAPARFTDGQLNIPESGNGVPDILDEAAWSLKLWRGLQDADGGVFGGTESNGDPNFGQTVELDPLGDYAYAKDTWGSFNFAGAFAQASRLWRALGRTAEADDLLARARRAYAWAKAHEPATGTPPRFATAHLCPQAYAAAELLRTTGESVYNSDYLSAAVWRYRPDADLTVYQLYDQERAAYGYCQAPAKLADPTVQAAAKRALLRWSDWELASNATMAYPFIRHPQAPITWGTGAYQHSSMPVLYAWKLTGETKYLTWLLRTADNTLGANPLGLSWITGLGERCHRAPLHNSRYGPTGEVAPGLQSEGPNARGEGYRVAEVAYPKIRDNFAIMYTYADCHFAISMDEGMVKNQAETMAVFGVLAAAR